MRSPSRRLCGRRARFHSRVGSWVRTRRRRRKVAAPARSDGSENPGSLDKGARTTHRAPASGHRPNVGTSRCGRGTVGCVPRQLGVHPCVRPDSPSGRDNQRSPVGPGSVRRSSPGHPCRSEPWRGFRAAASLCLICRSHAEHFPSPAEGVGVIAQSHHRPDQSYSNLFVPDQADAKGERLQAGRPLRDHVVVSTLSDPGRRAAPSRGSRSRRGSGVRRRRPGLPDRPTSSPGRSCRGRRGRCRRSPW